MPGETENRPTDQALRESEARTWAILEAAVDAIITIDHRGTVDSMNPSAERLFGYSAAEVVGQNVKMLMPSPYQEEHDGYLKNYLTTGVKKIIGIGREVVGRKKDGSTFPMHLAVSELRLGTRQMFTGIARDITDLARAINELKDSEARTRAVLDAAVDAIITIDERGIVESLNPSAERLFGYAAQEVIGQNVKMLMPAPYHEEHDGYLNNYITTGQRKIIGIGREVVGRRKDRSTFPMHLAVSELWLGNRRMFTGIARDITDLGRAMRDLKDSEARTRAVLDAAVDAIITIDREGTVDSMNPSAERLFGYPSAEVIGRNVKMLMPSPYQEEHDGYLKNYLTTGVKKIIGSGREVVGRKKNGATFPMHLAVSELRVGGQQMFTGIARDITDLKGAVRELEDSEARTRTILETAVDAIITIDERGVVESLNPAAERLFGYSGAEVVGQNVKMLMPEPYKNEHDGYLRNYLTTGQKKIIGIGREVVGLRKDGTTFPMDLAVSEVRLGDRRLFTGIVRDISSLKGAIRNLEDSEARTRAVLQTAVDAIITIDEKGIVESLNPAAERLFGYPAEEVMGQNVKILMPSPYCEEHDGYLHNYLTTGVKKIIGSGREVVGLRKNRTTFPMHLAVSELWLGERRMFTGIARDITDLKRAIGRIEDSEARTRTILETAVDAIITIDERGVVESMNPAAERLFGYSGPEVVGQNVKMLMPEPYKNEHDGYLRNYLTTGQKKIIGIGREVVGLRKDGTTFPMDLAVSEVRLGDRRLFTGIVRDISDRQQAEARLRFYADELQGRNAELIRSNQELDDFAYIASHDLKEPLRGIHNYSSFLIEDYSNKVDDEGREKLETLKTLSQRMDGLLDSLLDFSRVGRLEFAMRTTDLNEVVGEVVESLRITIDERNISIRVPHPLPTVWCDRVRVGEVYRNLITNAMKYNDKPERWIEIGQGWPADCGENPLGADATGFYVRDNGIGIPKKHFEVIFRIFKRLHGRDVFGGGTGVGLTIVKKIIERHGGRIGVQSLVGRGTIFYFTLGTESIAMPQQNSILLVEDSPEDYETTVRAFKKAGLTVPVFRCADGDEALNFLYRRDAYVDAGKAPRPSLILLDLNLPGTDGREVLATIKQDTGLKTIPVLILTTSADHRDIENCYQAGANCYIRKPVDLTAFMESIRRLAEFWYRVVILPQKEEA